MPPSPRIEKATLKDKGKADGIPWEYSVAYVRLSGDLDPVARAKVNRRIREVADADIAYFRTTLSDRGRPDPALPDEFGSEATTAVTAGRFLSVVNQSYIYYSGGAHGTSVAKAMVFDLTTGAELARDALFKPGTAYEAALAAPALRQVVAECGPVDLATVRSELARRDNAAMADDEPAAAFSLTESAVRIDFQHYAVGPGACGTVRVLVPFAEIRDFLAPEILAGPPLLPAPPDEACTVSSSSIHMHGEGNVFGLFVGADGWVDVAAKSDKTFELGVKGRLRVGVQGVFGRQASAAGAGAGASGTIAAGLQAGVATTFGAKDEDALRKLVAALDGSGPPPDSADGVAVASRTMEMGVWLSGDIGLGGTKGGAEIEGVIGATVSLANEQPAFVTYYLAARGSISVTLAVGGDKQPSVVPSAAASAGAEYVVGVVTDMRNQPLTLVEEMTASLQGSFDLEASLENPDRLFRDLRKLAASGGSERGGEVRLVGKLDLADPAHLGVVQAAMGVDATDVDRAALAQLLDSKGRHTIELRDVRQESGDVFVRAGAGLGVAVGISAGHTTRQITGASFKAPGANPRLWTTCWDEA